MFKKKKFDRVNGEDRVCKVCNETFHTKKPRWMCMKCIAKHSFDVAKSKVAEGYIPTGKFAGMIKKPKYPFDTNPGKGKTVESLRRWTRIRKELDQCKTREERQAHYQKQLEEIKTNGIWEWIWDRRNIETIKSNRKKTKTLTERDYPDTRNLDYE